MMNISMGLHQWSTNSLINLETLLLTQRLELSKDEQLANKSDTPITREFQRR